MYRQTFINGNDFRAYSNSLKVTMFNINLFRYPSCYIDLNHTLVPFRGVLWNHGT